MTKRIWTLSFAMLALALVSYNASASRARIATWGTGEAGAILGTSATTGSLFVNDAYNMFYNPSYLNGAADMAVIEKAQSNTPGSAFGGFTHKFMGFGLGFFFNRTGSVSGIAATERPIEFLFAGDHGVKWGLGVAWASNKTSAVSTAKTDKDLTLRAGIQFMNFEPFAEFTVMGVKDTDVGTNNIQDKYTNMAFGLKYKFGEWTPAAAIRMQTQTINNGAKDTVKQNWGLGIGRNTKLGEGVTLNYSTGYWHSRTGSGGALTDTRKIPVNVSASGDVTSWLTLRGGLVYNAMSITGDVTNASETVGGTFGSSINVGAVSFDWAVGSTAGTENPMGVTFDFANGL